MSVPEPSSKIFSAAPQKPPYSAVSARAHRGEIFIGPTLRLSPDRWATASIAKRLQEGLCDGRVARGAPVTVRKKMNRISR